MPQDELLELEEEEDEEFLDAVSTEDQARLKYRADWKQRWQTLQGSCQLVHCPYRS